MSVLLTDPVVIAVKKAFKDLDVAARSKLLAGVSGGIDSMVMATVLRELGYSLSVAHVNFQLRGIDSDEDALLVRNWCAQYNVPYFEYVIDTHQYQEIHGLNTQSAAREIRYQWWEELVRKNAFDYLVTAHQQDDSIETFFINLLRGTGIKGLTGIPAKRGYFLRPMLRITRKEIERFAAKHEIPFRTDRSNESDQYQRNRIRNHLIPLLKELTPDADARLDQTLYRIRTEWESWEESYKRWVLDNVSHSGKDYYINAGKSEYAFVLRWLEQNGFPWQLAYDFVMPEKANKGIVLSQADFILSRRKDGFTLSEKVEVEPVVLDKPGIFRIDGDELSIAIVPASQFEVPTDPFTEFISIDAIQWPMNVRPVTAGDRFRPFGMKGRSKKLQDYLVDLKMDAHEKSNIRVLVSGKEILWVIGHRLSEKARVDPQKQKEAYKLIYRKKGI